MKPTPLIAANWKMNKLPSEAVRWAEVFLKEFRPGPAEVVICAPFTHLAPLRAALVSSSVALGAQDVSAHTEGAYTGEVAAAMLADLGVSYVIVGHSERREYHAEDDALVNAKLKTVLEHELKPILCVGESLDQREAGEALTVVRQQLEADLTGVTSDHAHRLVIAYEPIWAIGTGKTATAADAQEVCQEIRETLKRRYPDHAEGIRILYGGSMKPDNAAELFAQPAINGGLVGGASLAINSLLAIVEATRV